MLYGASLMCVTVAVVHAVVHASPNGAPAQRAPFRLRFDPYDDTWRQFKHDFERDYAGDEETSRRAVFMDNVQTMERHNWRYYNGNASFYLGINQFSDMTVEEYRQYNKLRTQPRNDSSVSGMTCTQFSSPLNWRAPSSVDWRTKGYVTPVKNQGQCGSCWAFSTTGSLEGQHFRKTGQLVSLAEQQLVDCCFQNAACNGGWMDYAFEYINSAGGIEPEYDYPYYARQGQCAFRRGEVAADLRSCQDVAAGSEEALQQAVGSQGPVSVAIDATHASFMSYAGGVYVEPACSSADLDHAVLAVGYGSQGGQQYWLVKNSWSTSWGMEGYILMARNRNNQCGIATKASFPVV